MTKLAYRNITKPHTYSGMQRSSRKPKVKVKRIRVWYCPDCVDEGTGCPYHFKPGKCPEHPRTKLVYDKELSRMLTAEVRERAGTSSS